MDVFTKRYTDVLERPQNYATPPHPATGSPIIISPNAPLAE